MNSAKKKLSTSVGKHKKPSSYDGSVKVLSQQSARAAMNAKKRRNVSRNNTLSNRRGQTTEFLQLEPVSSSFIACQNNSKKVPEKKLTIMTAVSSNIRFNKSDSSDDCLIVDDDSEPESISQYLELEVRTDLDNTPFPTVDLDSDEEVVVLGEKQPTYEEITIDEDDNGVIFDNFVQKRHAKSSETLSEVEELLYKCSQCEKSFRVESLLKFHVRMHGSDATATSVHVTSDSPVQIVNCSGPSVPSATATSPSEVGILNPGGLSDRSPKKSPKSNQKSVVKEKENEVKSENTSTNKTNSPRKLTLRTLPSKSRK